MSKMNNIYAVLVFLHSALSLQLPDFIKQCRSSDPNLDVCILQHATEALPYILKGVEALRLPPLSPLFIPEIQITNANDLSLTLKNVSVNGLETAKLRSTRNDLKKIFMSFVIEFEQISFHSKYQVEGKLLFLPIKGDGDAYIALDKPVFDLRCNFNLKQVKGHDHLNIEECKVDYAIQNAHFNLTNLFNGDQRLGDQMNIFLNENWKDINEDVRPSIQNVVSQIAVDLVVPLLTKVKFVDVFIP